MEKVKINTKSIICLLFLVCVFLQGCGEKEFSNQMQEETGIRVYSKETTDLKITPDYIPKVYLMAVTDSLCYFGQETIEEKGEKVLYNTQFYYKPLEEKGEATLVTEVVGVQVLAFHLFQDSSGQDTLCILTEEEEKCVLTEYTSGGEVISQLDIIDSGFKDVQISDLFKCGEEVYIAYNANIMYVLQEGRVSKPIECPGDYFQNGIVLENDTVYMVYLENESMECFLTKVDLGSAVLSEKIPLPGTGRPVFVENGKLLLMDNEALWRYDIATQKSEKLLNIAEYNILSHKVHLLDCKDDVIRMISWEAGNGQKAVHLLTLTKKSEDELSEELKALQDEGLNSAKYDEDGKRIITLYDPYALCANGIIDTFNENNTEYTVIVESGNLNVETVLASKSSPDLMFSLQGNNIQSYQSSGYLENLVPFIEKSENISMENLQEGILQYFTFDGGLYAVPQTGTLETLMCLQSQVGNKAGWTVDEFLTWLEENPDIKSTNGLSQEKILEYCLKGNFEAYINLEQGTPELTSYQFKELLERIKKMRPDENSYAYEPFAEYDTTGTRLFDEYVSDLLSVAQMEYVFEEQLVNMGYPCDSGKPKMIMNCWMNLSILSRSECKEGAYAFVEHYLLYDSKVNDENPMHERTLWTFKARMQKEMEASDEYVISCVDPEDEENILREEYKITDEQENMLLEMLESATPDTYEMFLIRDIIWEEAQSYFQDQKDLDTVCDIMQSRVSILLSERR